MRIPRYGFAGPPPSITGNRKSKKTVQVVTSTTPIRLIQLSDKYTSGISQERSLSSMFRHAAGQTGCHAEILRISPIYEWQEARTSTSSGAFHPPAGAKTQSISQV